MTSLDDMACRVGPGDGLAARFGSAAVIVQPWGQSQRAALEEIVGAVERCGGQPAGGRLLCRQLAGLLAREEPSLVPTFVALGESERGLAVLVHGDVDAAISDSQGGETVSGRHAATWVDRIIDHPIDSLAVARAGRDARELDELFDLRAGVVPAGSLLLTRSRSSFDTADLSDPARQARSESRSTLSPSEREREVVTGPGSIPGPGDRPEGVPGPGGRPAGVEAGSELRPKVPAAASDDAPTSFRTIPLDIGPLEAPRAPLPIAGEPTAAESKPQSSRRLLIFDDGTTFSLDSEVVVGREPETDPTVVSGQAQPLVVTDDERSVSRVHLRVVPHKDDVQVLDLRSANGTAIRRPGDRAWQPLAPGVATTIPPDTEVRLGERTFMFDALGRR